MLFLSLIDNNDGDENAQSILEDHCNRIGWDISRGQWDGQGCVGVSRGGGLGGSELG